MRKKWTLRQVLGIDPPPKRTDKNAPISVTCQGKQYANIAELAKDYGLSGDKVSKRIRANWTVEQAVGVEDRKYDSRPKEISVQGTKFASRNEAARNYGVNIGTVADRVNKRGWTLEQALGIEKRPEGTTLAYGFTYIVTNKSNQKSYVGITRQHLDKRFEQHLATAKGNNKPPKGGLHEAKKKAWRRKLRSRCLR